MANNVTVDFDVSKLVRAIEQASADMQKRAGEVVARASAGTASAWKGLIPVGPRGTKSQARKGPHLRDTVRASKKRDLAYQVRAGAPHAHLWEAGTISRFHKRSGKGTGRMPAARKLVASAQEQRRQMLAALAAVIPTKDLG
jgi:hypothetical protein